MMALVSMVWAPQFKVCGLPSRDATPRSSLWFACPSFSLVDMVFLRALLIPVCVATATVFASPWTDSTCPVVTLDKGTFIGTTANGTNRFLGIPYAHPPSVLDFGLAHSPL